MASTSPENGGKDEFPDDPFWGFSLATYLRPEVATVCLGLQDRHGVDVNMVLFCCWVGASGGGTLSGAEMDAALAAAGPWQRDVIVPLRSLRQDLKGSGKEGEKYRQQVAAAEIDAEHAEQLLISASWTRPPDLARNEDLWIGDACANLRRYFEVLDLTPDDRDRPDLAILLGGAFPRPNRPDVPAIVEKELYSKT